jgi:hypothetical protein
LREFLPTLGPGKLGNDRHRFASRRRPQAYIRSRSPHSRKGLGLNQSDDYLLAVGRVSQTQRRLRHEGNDEIIRIISARKATKRERKAYQEG